MIWDETCLGGRIKKKAEVFHTIALEGLHISTLTGRGWVICNCARIGEAEEKV